jgi:hypothetical protein
VTAIDSTRNLNGWNALATVHKLTERPNAQGCHGFDAEAAIAAYNRLK